MPPCQFCNCKFCRTRRKKCCAQWKDFFSFVQVETKQLYDWRNLRSGIFWFHIVPLWKNVYHRAESKRLLRIFFFNPRLYYIYSKYIHIDNSLRREWVPHVLSGNLFKCKQFPLSRVIINFLRAQFQTIYKWLERRAAQCAVTSRNVRLARSSDAFVTTWKTMRFAECSSAARMERMIDAHISDALVAFVGVSSSSWFAVITSATLDALFCQRARTIDTPLVRFIHPDFFLECTITPERHPTTIDSTANYLAVSCMWNNAD